ncbi:sce7725 family protein [Marivirga harenae]|uniref:sce7725 family protein n=1 Tax=Marivirga harenae TaxID=2010992 RepID=UPI0026DF3C74|nr:sce7725 family protein [Marivirga harenae]WKV14029.1 sce7725 family protein [Marivirga harenae]
MYYPLLRARQFELITIRELVSENAIQGVVTPIFEPVKETHNNLDIAFDIFQQGTQSAYLILNPDIGEIPGDGTHYLNYLISKQPGTYLPAFRYRSNGEYIRQAIENGNLENCMIICQNDVDANSIDFTQLAELRQVTAFNVEDPGRNRRLRRYLNSLQKTFIRLDDPFEKQIRNSDFLTIPEHLFSEEHLYFDTEDDFDGFSDYTVLASEFIEGGSTPRAVVIHLTYLQDQDEIWIRHFTSDTNDSIANVQGKFAEAAEKAVSFCRANGLSNAALEELFDHFDEQHYPGLGTVKKISMKNHILVVAGYLSGR